MSRKPRLCIVTPNHSMSLPGGSEYQIACLLNVLVPLQRYEIFYVTHVVSGSPAQMPYQLVQIGDGAQTPRFGYVTHAAPLYRALTNLSPDVIYQRVGCGYTGISAYYARHHRKRLVWHVASDTDVDPRESLDGRNPVRRFLEKRSVEYGIRRATCVVTQTAHQAEMLRQHYRRSPDAIIPNFHPDPTQTLDKSGPLTVVWVSSFKQFKQPDVFLRVAAALRERSDVHFVLIGPMSPATRAQPWGKSVLETMANASNVEYLGSQSQDEVNEVLARAHVFVNTSLYEGFPNTFIQAWMREAVVVSLHIDPDKLLEQKGLGIFCGSSETKLLEAVRTLVTDEPLRNSLASRGRDYARATHSLANASSLVQLLETTPAAS
jgi:glycosyltransferase involved in cell wall biosynthesis